MAEAGNDSDQKDQSRDNSQIVDTSHIFQKGYNQRGEKILARINEQAGTEFKEIDELYPWISDMSTKLSQNVSDPTQTDEYKALKLKLDEQVQKAQQAEEKAQQVSQQYTFDDTWGKAIAEREGGYVIPPEKIKTLFKTEYEVDYKTQSVKKGGIPMLDEKGSPVKLEKVMSEYAAGFSKAVAEGTGGGSGAGGAVKPKFSDFQKATQAGDQETADKLLNDFAESGNTWAEE